MDAKSWTGDKNHKHVLGMIRYNGEGIPQLALYRHAIDENAEHLEDVDVIGVLEGRMPIICGVCGEIFVWEISEQVLESMLARMNGQKLMGVIMRMKARNEKTKAKESVLSTLDNREARV